jgi:hypothetical protein
MRRACRRGRRLQTDDVAERAGVLSVTVSGHAELFDERIDVRL